MTMLSRRVPGSETRLYQVTPRFRPKYLGFVSSMNRLTAHAPWRNETKSVRDVNDLPMCHVRPPPDQTPLRRGASSPAL